jgi:hypothetical protein
MQEEFVRFVVMAIHKDQMAAYFPWDKLRHID